MEEKLNEINKIFQYGKHNEAISCIKTVIEESSNDSLLYKAYDLLGKYLNFMGQHVEAVQAWEDGLKFLESTVGGIDEPNIGNIDWINISLRAARIIHRLGKDEIIKAYVFSMTPFLFRYGWTRSISQIQLRMLYFD